MKNIASMVPVAMRTSSNAASTISHLADSIGAGFKQLMTAGILGTLATLILAPPATADIPPGFTFVRCTGTPLETEPVNHSQSCGGTFGDSAAADLSATSARAAGTALDGTYGGDEVGIDLRFGSSAQSNYYFAIIPSGEFDPSVTVPVRIDSFLTAGTTGTEGDFLDHTYGEADLLVRTGNITDLGLVACSGFGCSDGTATVDGSVVVQLYPLAWNEVSLTASVLLDSLFQSSASALADPFIQIDPAFLSDHPGYSVIFSANVTNGPLAGAPVPEPAAAWLLGSGLLALIARKFGRGSAARGRQGDRYDKTKA